MKRNCLLLTVLMLLIVVPAEMVAQKSVILHHEGTPSFYPSVNEALAAALDNDTLYISGGIYVENITIDKDLAIYGAGHYPDSSAATGVTRINGNIEVDGVSFGFIEGVYLNDITFRNGSSGYTVSRCNVNRVLYASGSTYSNFSFTESVVRNQFHFINSADNILIEKCLLGNNITSFDGSTLVIRNNIFLWTPTTYRRIFEVVYGAIVQNNIFMLTTGALTNTSLDDNHFENNIFVFDQTGLNSTNLTGVDPTTLFVNQEGMVFDYQHDYHSAIGSPAIGFGEDGTDAGIYGTSLPYKESAVPSNPHFSTAEIADQTDGEGKLSVKIRITGQNR